MVFSSGEDVVGAVELFEQDDAHQLMREGHFGYRQAQVAVLFDCVGQTVRTADYEAEVRAAVCHSLGQVSCKLGRRILLALDAERDSIRARRYRGEYALALAGDGGIDFSRARVIGQPFLTDRDIIDRSIAG